MICFATSEELEEHVALRLAPILAALAEARRASFPRRCNHTTIIDGRAWSCEGDLDHQGDSHGTSEGLRWPREVRETRGSLNSVQGINGVQR